MKLKKWICRCLLLGLLTLFCIFIFLSLEGPQREQKEIAEHIIRFHVIANSDSERDQSLKLMVRDAVLKQMDVWTKHSQNLAETRSVLNSHLSDIEALAQETQIGRAHV